MTSPLPSFHSSKPKRPSADERKAFAREVARRMEAAERGDLHDEQDVFDQVDRMIQQHSKGSPRP